MEPTTNVVTPNARYATILFVVLGGTAIVFAGLFSAATARSASYHSAWFVAYLVLIVGLAQVLLGIGQWWLASKPLTIRTIVSELAFFNIGNAGVIVGTLLAEPLVVDVGSAFFVIALVLFARNVWVPRRRGAALWAYWALIFVLLISVFVGIYFAHTAAL